jgi:hypothetical protein
MVTGVPASVTSLSANATGGRFCTVTDTVAVAFFPAESRIVYVKEIDPV